MSYFSGEIQIKYTSELSKKLFQVAEENIITVWDATYVYIEKSSNYSFQKKSFSSHKGLFFDFKIPQIINYNIFYKGRNLVKIMLLVTTKGHIIACFGPYLADGKNNDARILIHQFSKNKDDFSNFFKQSDIFVVDRGFRDCVEFLKDLGMDVFMPHFLYVGKQHTTKESNESRIITKNRWVVEAVNGLIKRWLFFNNVVSNNNLKYIQADFEIICAIINRFKNLRFVESENSGALAEQMLQKLKKNNDLIELVQNLSSRVRKNNIMTDPNQINFPELDEDYLCELSFGSYQLRQAKSYVVEHLTVDGKYNFEIFNDYEGLIRTKIKSRHTSQTIYNTWIKFDKNNETDPINGWYCTCKSGARVVGCCAHVASVLWFLGFFRFNREIKLESINLNHIFLDASKLPKDPIDGDE